nr:MAG TPA: hypothetical protein [Inoviridae sp.]
MQTKSKDIVKILSINCWGFLSLANILENYRKSWYTK